MGIASRSRCARRSRTLKQNLDRAAGKELERCNELKRRKYGKQPEKLPAAMPSMPDDGESKIVPA